MPVVLPGTGESVATETISGDEYQIIQQLRVTTATLSNVADSATSVSLLASTAGRRGCIIVNDSTEALYLKYGATASTTSFTVKLGPGQYWEMPTPIYTGAIDGIWAASASGSARITELTA